MIGNVVKVMRIATGEEEEDYGEQPAKPGCRRVGSQGWCGSREEHECGRRAEIAKKAAAKRWSK